MSSKISAFLYKNVIELTVQEGQRINLPMYRKNSRIFKGVDNKIDFTLTNTDRKPVKILGGHLKMFVFDNVTDEVMLESFATIVDDVKGKFKIVIEAGEIDSWDAGFYRFSVIYKDFEDLEQVVYMDFTQGSTGVLELVDDSTPKFVPSTVIIDTDFKAENNYLVTGRYPGDAQRLFKDDLHTAFIYFTDFTGTFSIQGSLEEYPSQASHYFDILTFTITDFTGIKDFNFVGNYPWIRFKNHPDPILNLGTFDKILYKH